MPLHVYVSENCTSLAWTVFVAFVEEAEGLVGLLAIIVGVAKGSDTPVLVDRPAVIELGSLLTRGDALVGAVVFYEAGLLFAAHISSLVRVFSVDGCFESKPQNKNIGIRVATH